MSLYCKIMIRYGSVVYMRVSHSDDKKYELYSSFSIEVRGNFLAPVTLNEEPYSLSYITTSSTLAKELSLSLAVFNLYKYTIDISR